MRVPLQAPRAVRETSTVRAYVAAGYRHLSRLDELSADAVALQLVGEREAAYSGLTMLMAGPQLLPFVNRDQLMRQAAEVDADSATLKAERALTHPFLARRLHQLRNVPLSQRR